MINVVTNAGDNSIKKRGLAQTTSQTFSCLYVDILKHSVSLILQK